MYQVTKWAGFDDSGNHINNPLWAGNGSAASLPAGYHPFSGSSETQYNSPYLASFGGVRAVVALRSHFQIAGYGHSCPVRILDAKIGQRDVAIDHFEAIFLGDFCLPFLVFGVGKKPGFG